MILHKLMPDGAFVCGDTKTGATVYAYPTSQNAENAKKDPEGVAFAMLAIENAYATRPAIGRGSPRLVAEYDRLQWEKLGGRPCCSGSSP